MAGKGFGHEELMGYVPTIINNVIQNIKTLVKYSDELAPPSPVTSANLVHSS